MVPVIKPEMVIWKASKRLTRVLPSPTLVFSNQFREVRMMGHTLYLHVGLPSVAWHMNPRFMRDLREGGHP